MRTLINKIIMTKPSVLSLKYCSDSSSHRLLETFAVNERNLTRCLKKSTVQPFRKCSIRLKFGDSRDHLSRVKFPSRSWYQSCTIRAPWHGVDVSPTWFFLPKMDCPILVFMWELLTAKVFEQASGFHIPFEPSELCVHKSFERIPD